MNRLQLKIVFSELTTSFHEVRAVMLWLNENKG